MSEPEVEMELRRCIELNHFIGEPHVLLGQLFFRQARYEEAAYHSKVIYLTAAPVSRAAHSCFRTTFLLVSHRSLHTNSVHFGVYLRALSNRLH